MHAPTLYLTKLSCVILSLASVPDKIRHGCFVEIFFRQTLFILLDNIIRQCFHQLTWSIVNTELDSNWILMSCQQHRVTSGQSNSVISKCTLRGVRRVQICLLSARHMMVADVTRNELTRITSLSNHKYRPAFLYFPWKQISNLVHLNQVTLHWYPAKRFSDSQTPTWKNKSVGLLHQLQGWSKPCTLKSSVQITSHGSKSNSVSL